MLADGREIYLSRGPSGLGPGLPYAFCTFYRFGGPSNIFLQKNGMSKCMFPGAPVTGILGADTDRFNSFDLATLGNGKVVAVAGYSRGEGDDARSFIAVTLMNAYGQVTGKPVVPDRVASVEGPFGALDPGSLRAGGADGGRFPCQLVTAARGRNPDRDDAALR